MSRMLTLRTAGRFESGATGLLHLGAPAHTQANEESRRAERSSCLSICVCVCVCVCGGGRRWWLREHCIYRRPNDVQIEWVYIYRGK